MVRAQDPHNGADPSKDFGPMNTQDRLIKLLIALAFLAA